jgi:hypothetical protein
MDTVPMIKFVIKTTLSRYPSKNDHVMVSKPDS